MGNITDSLRQNNWKPEASSDGEFKPLVGTYLTAITALRPDVDKKNNNAKFYELEVKPKEKIDGDEFSERFSFKKRFYVDGDKAAEKLKDMLNILFTAGVELDLTSDASMEADFNKAIGKSLHVRSWGWTNDAGKQIQMWVAQKAGIAEKKRNAGSHAF